MAEEKPQDALDLISAQTTYKIILTLVDHIDAASSLIALMASGLGEDATRRITETAAWANYLTARRALETVRPELEKFAASVTNIAESQSTATDKKD
jgi:hypothetical protein